MIRISPLLRAAVTHYTSHLARSSRDANFPTRAIVGPMTGACDSNLQLLRWLSDGPSELVLIIGTTGTAGCSEETRNTDESSRFDLNAVAGVIGAKLDCSKASSFSRTDSAPKYPRDEGISPDFDALQSGPGTSSG